LQINVYSLQPSDNQEETATPVVSDDPFAAAMNASAATSSAFALRHPPKWLRRPVGGTFGFGGKLVTFNNKAGQAAAQAAANAPPGQAPAPQSVPRAIHITSVVTDPETAQRADELEKAVQEENMDQWIDQRIEQAKANKDDKESWEVIKTLLAADAREQLMNYLGFEKQQVMDAVAKITADKQTVSITPTEEPVVEEEKPAVEEEESAEKPAEDAVVEDAATQEAGKEVSGLFQGEEGGDDFFIQSDNTQTPAAQEMDALVSAIKKEPLQLYAEGSSEEDRLITRAVILGDFESAVNLCLATDRLSDALLFAICGGGDLLARTQAAYFKLKSNSYLRLLESVVQDDLESVVASVSLDEWTSVIVVLCTFAKAEEFGPLCEALAARLEEGWSRADTEGAKDYRRHATLCYLAAGNMEKVTRIWIAEQQEEVEESKGDDAVYAASLQHLMEKVTVFRKVIGFQDDAIAADPNETTFALSSLYDKYIEYSELLAAQGKLASALRYLNLTPVGYKKSTNDKSYLVRDRVYHACPSSVSNQVAAPAALYGGDLIQSTAEVQYQQQQQQQPVSTSYQPVTTGIQQQQQQSRSAYAPISSPLTTHQYAAPATNAYTPVSNAYAPTYTPTTTNSYAPTTNTNTYTPTTTYTPAATQPYTPNTATGPATNAYQPQAVSTPPSTQMYNNTSGYNQYNSGGYNYGNDQYTNSAYTPGRTSIPQPPPIIGSNPTASPHQSPSAPPPPPKKVEGAWNDPPMAIAASKKVKSPKPSAPTKRVMSPFPNQPAQSSFVPQQQQPGFPPPPQGPPMMGQGPPQGPPMMGPPRPPMGAPPMGAPPMMGPPRGQTPPARQPLPPPPMNAAPPMAMAKQRPPPPPMGGYYQAGQRN
jgi:protein transport protein SEC31